MFQRSTRILLVSSLAFLGLGAAPAPAIAQDPELGDRDLAKLGDAMADWLEARKESEGISDAIEDIQKSLEKIQKKAKKDPMSMPADIGRAWWLSKNYSKVRGIKKGNLTDGSYDAGSLGEVEFVYRTPKKYDPKKSSYPVILCAHDEGQRPEDHLRDNWMNAELLDSAILICPQLPEDRGTWSETTVDGKLGGLGVMLFAYRAATEQFAIDFNRIYLAGRGAGVELAMISAAFSPDRFAGLIGRNGDAGDLSPDNFGNLASIFVAAAAKATAFEEKAKELGFDNVTLSPGADEAQIWNWIQEHPRQAYPEKVTFFPVGKTVRSYWVQVAPENTPDRKLVATLDRENNKVVLESENVREVVLYFSDAMLDLDKPVTVEANGVSNELKIPRDFQRTLDYLFNARCDPGRIFVYSDTISLQ